MCEVVQSVEQIGMIYVNRYRQKRPKVDASIFDAALSHNRRSDASEKKGLNSVSTFGRFRLWTSFKSSSVSVMTELLIPPVEDFQLKSFMPFVTEFLKYWGLID